MKVLKFRFIDYNSFKKGRYHMVALAKRTMVEELVNSGKVKSLKQEKENNATFAKRLFSMDRKELEALYEKHIGKNPEQAVEEIVKKASTITKKSIKVKEEKKVEEKPVKTVEKKVEKKSTKKAKAPKITAAEKAKAEKEARLQAMSPEERALYKPKKDAEGYQFAKAWIVDLLEKAKFSKMSKNKTKTLKGKIDYKYAKGAAPAKLTLTYNYEKNSITVTAPDGTRVQHSLCLCEFMIRKLINKYAGLNIAAPIV